MLLGGLWAGGRIGSVKASLFGVLAGFRYICRLRSRGSGCPVLIIVGRWGRKGFRQRYQLGTQANTKSYLAKFEILSYGGD